MNFEEGKAYFEVDYSENELIVPNIQTYIFAGKNVLSGDVEDKYYFQTPDCYFKNGPFFKITDQNLKNELEILSMGEEFAEMLYTIETLQELLESKQLSHPNMFGLINEN